MEVADGWEEGGGGVKGDGIGAHGDEGNAGTGVVRKDVGVKPECGCGAAGREGGDQVVGYGEEKEDIAVCEGADGGRGGVDEADGGDAEGLEGGDHLLGRWEVRGGRVVGDAQSGGGRGGDGGGEEEKGGAGVEK